MASGQIIIRFPSSADPPAMRTDLVHEGHVPSEMILAFGSKGMPSETSARHIL